MPSPRQLTALLVLTLVTGCAAVNRPPGTGDGATLSPADSALVGRILLAEDRRDASNSALVDGEQSGDALVRAIARRARGRIADPRYAARDSMPPVPAPVTWTEPAWRLRYRALAGSRADCAALRTALGDSVWHVRLRAADLVTASCAGDDSLVATLTGWVASLRADASRREADGVSWHAAAHALVALARLRPAEARIRMRVLAGHQQPQVRTYAARAAGVLADTLVLRRLARLDADDNVREAAIEELARVAPGDVETFIAALESRGAQSVRAAAIALKGSKQPDVVRAATAAFTRWMAHQNASERDVRIALLEASGRPASYDRPPAPRSVLPPRAIDLALGADVRLRVRMSPASGGGSFVVRLRGDVAPMMAARILALVNQHYYDGLAWHRVEPDFVIQGGSPGANEYVGLASYLRDELGTIPHVRGTVGMSTRGHDTGDAQWFVNLKDNLRLGADYTVFAEVVEGMDVVDGIMAGDVIERIEEVAP